MNDNIIKTYIPDGLEVKRESNIISYCVKTDDIVQVCNALYFSHKLQLKTITAVDERNDKGWFRILYVFGIPKQNIFLVPYIILKNKEEFPSITRNIHEASGYERKIKTFFGLSPIGHPSIQKILLHENWPDKVFPLRKDFNWQTRPKEAHGIYEFQKVEGEGIYEIPVGPVHAGIIEPGHFRFSVAGEKIMLLKPKLGYKHKGSEKLFEILPLEDKVRLSERISGDTSFTHSQTFCQAIESLADIKIPEKAKYLRVIFSELERLSNHINDIGFIMLDTGYNFGGSNCARLREAVMQWSDIISGSRFLRGINAIGGVKQNIDKENARKLLEALKKIHLDFNEVIEVSESSSSLFNRLSGTGKVDRQIAKDHGAFGVAGRALGFEHDARIDYPYASYDKFKFNIALEKDGDVRARWAVRIKEVHSSMQILEQAIRNIPSNEELKISKDILLKKNSCGISITEGWRGDIVYVVVTDSSGQISRVDVRDPSFINWNIMEHSIYDNIIPDFPLINKSFNLSYSGNDL